MEHIEIWQNQDGSWYAYDLAKEKVVIDNLPSEKEAYDYARFQYVAYAV